MKHTAFFIFLITNIVSGAMLETPPTFFTWNPYSPTDSKTSVSPAPLRLPPAVTASSPTAPLPIFTKTEDTFAEQEMSPQALSSGTSEASSPTSHLDLTAASNSPKTSDLLHSKPKTRSLEDQQIHLNETLEKLKTISPGELTSDQINIIFQELQNFLNREHSRLGHPSPQEYSLILQQKYEQILRFYESVTTLPIFSKDQQEKLLCFYVSALIGTANICGIRRDNLLRITYLKQALSIIKTMKKDVLNPYGKEINFYRTTMIALCKSKISETMKYLTNDQRTKLSLEDNR